MADDLEAFLRQAAQRRAQRQKQGQPKRPPAEKPPAARRPPPVEPRRTPSAPVQEVVEVQVVPQDEPSRLGMRVTTSEFEQRAEKLGEEVGLADEMLEAHLHDKFDHQVGSLDQDSSTQAATAAAQREVPSAVGELIDLLQSPKSLRQAIVLGEILAPPEHRW